MTKLLHLWTSRIRRLWGHIRSEQTRTFQVPLFLIVAVIFWLALYEMAKWVGTKALVIEPVGELALQGLLSLILVIIFVVLVFSNTVTAFNTFFSDRELEFLVSAPIGLDTFFVSRFLETILHASWIVFVFGLPFLAGLGVAMEASWTFYGQIGIVLVPFVVIPACLGAIVSLVFTFIWRLAQHRETFMYLGGVAVVGVFVAFRMYQPHRFFSPETFESTQKILQLLSSPVSSWVPSQWAAEALYPSFLGIGVFNFDALGMLYSTAFAGFFLTMWIYRAFYFRSFSSAQEGRHRGGYLSTFIAKAQSWTTGSILDKEPDSIPWRSLAKKDLKVTIRDPGQWTQLIVVGALMFLYLFNYRYFGVASDIKLIQGFNLYFFNLLIGDFILVALAGRFLFPSVSMEGRNFWLVRQAPLSLRKYLLAKASGSMIPVIVVGQVFVLTSSYLVPPPLEVAIGGAMTLLFHSVLISLLAISFGAVFPQFHNPNAAKIASGFGAVIFMVSTIFLALFSLTLIVAPLAGLEFFVQRNDQFALNVLYVAMGTGIVIPVVFAYVVLELGARSLKDETGY